MAENISKIQLNGTEYVIKDAATQYHTINGQAITGGTGDITITGGGGSSYTAGDGIDITNDVISVTGKVDTSTYSTYTAATDTALASKADTATTYTKTEVDTALSGKQDALVSGTNVKTINGQSLLGSGDIATVPVTTDNVNYTNSSSTKTLTQVLNNTEEITFTLEDGSTVTKKFILG